MGRTMGNFRPLSRPVFRSNATPAPYGHIEPGSQSEYWTSHSRRVGGGRIHLYCDPSSIPTMSILTLCTQPLSVPDIA
eukprot:522579-Rhodomonas_salina.7